MGFFDSRWIVEFEYSKGYFSSYKKTAIEVEASSEHNAIDKAKSVAKPMYFSVRNFKAHKLDGVSKTSFKIKPMPIPLEEKYLAREEESSDSVSRSQVNEGRTQNPSNNFYASNEYSDAVRSITSAQKGYWQQKMFVVLLVAGIVLFPTSFILLGVIVGNGNPFGGGVAFCVCLALCVIAFVLAVVFRVQSEKRFRLELKLKKDAILQKEKKRADDSVIKAINPKPIEAAKIDIKNPQEAERKTMKTTRKIELFAKEFVTAVDEKLQNDSSVYYKKAEYTKLVGDVMSKMATVEGKYWPEYFTIDHTWWFSSSKSVNGIKFYDWTLTAAVEHENEMNGANGWTYEVAKLDSIKSKMKLVIGYFPNDKADIEFEVVSKQVSMLKNIDDSEEFGILLLDQKLDANNRLRGRLYLIASAGPKLVETI
ncbi:MAG: hypothetical protein MJ239_07755 [Bacilli bacterium]|nr:hypothetical protein [Bacilli bacterium]